MGRIARATRRAEWWTHVPTLQPVTVTSASISLPFLRCRRTTTIQGGRSIKLDSYLADSPFAVPAATVTGATDPAFPVPPPLASCSQ